MTDCRTILGAIALLLTSPLCQGAPVADAQIPTPQAAKSPRAVVALWLELHRTGKRDQASALTTGLPDHQANHLLPSKRDTGVRVNRSLGNQRAAAVTTSPLKDGRYSGKVLLFWLVRRDGGWRINKSYAIDGRIADERLRGFLEAGDVRWHVRRGELLGHWEAGPCRPPGLGGVVCGSWLQLGGDGRYRLVAWGPAGRPRGNDPGHVMQGAWRLADGQILLSHGGRTIECRVAWFADNLLVVEPPDGRGRAEYERTDKTQSDKGDGASKAGRQRLQADRPVEKGDSATSGPARSVNGNTQSRSGRLMSRVRPRLQPCFQDSPKPHAQPGPQSPSERPTSGESRSRAADLRSKADVCFHFENWDRVRAYGKPAISDKLVTVELRKVEDLGKFLAFFTGGKELAVVEVSHRFYDHYSGEDANRELEKLQQKIKASGFGKVVLLSETAVGLRILRE